jgi:peptidoglycan/xylan/chitin deacetylase (PgdA/CDA1 family)
MSPDQIADLHRRGHVIGSHTLSHAPLSDLSLSQSRSEIVESAQLLSAWIESDVEAFAWPFSWDNISLDAWKLIARTYSFCFVPCPGLVRITEPMDRHYVLWRTHVEASYTMAEFRFMWSGLADLRWSRQRQMLRRLVPAALV